MSENDRFRVVIVGGGVAGLSLANALEQADVDYVLLERRDEVAPQVGASIGMFPSAARILDQLGAWKAVSEGSEPLQIFYTRDSKGRLITEPDRSSLLVHARTGYQTSWGERQNLLQVLYENLKDQSKILTNKDLANIKHDDTGVTAICADGSSFRGDILIGADGVFSKTRSQMWELAASDHPDLIEADKNCMISEYNCLFGITKGVACAKLAPGDVNTSYNLGRCCLSITADGDKVYYFAQERLPETYRLGNIPRYTEDDAADFVARHGDLIVVPGPNGLTLADLWQTTVSSRLVAIEEAKFKLWHWGRIGCVGDSIHKSTPNLGVGGNSAVESAAAVANGIKRLADSWRITGRRPAQSEVEKMLAEYKKIRELRANAIVDASGFLARAQNMHGLSTRLFVHYALPWLTEFMPELMGDAIIGAVKLDFLPLPMVSLTGTKPFNPAQGDGFRESRLKRILLALPLLGLAFAALWVLNAESIIATTAAIRDSGIFKPIGHVPILRTFYHIQGLDDFLALINILFFPSVYNVDPVSRQQLISFLTDGTVLLTIWIFESARRANNLTPLQFPNLFALAGQILGMGAIAPIYLFLHYTLSPIENFSSRDLRLTNTRVSYASLPAVLLAYLIPFYLVIYEPLAAARQPLLYLWQLYPVWLSLSVWAIGRLCFRDTVATDKLYHTEKDLPVMRWYVGAASALAAVVWVGTVWGAGMGGISGVFVPSALPRSLPSLVEFMGQFLRWDEVFTFASHLVWLGYLFWDLAAAGMLREGWLTAAGCGVASLLVAGPGATVGMGWLWREHILATRRHKTALTPETVGRLHERVV